MVNIVIVGIAGGGIPTVMNYQGRLLDGTNLVNGDVSLVFRIYTNSLVGDYFFEDSNTVSVADGHYSTYIGDDVAYGTLTNALAQDEAWLEVVVDGTPLTPRKQIMAVAYAVFAQGVAPGGVTTDMLADGAVNMSKLASGSVSTAKIDTSFNGWDKNFGNDLTTATSFAGDVMGTYNAMSVSNDSHSHGDATVNNSISINNGRLYAPAGSGSVGIGTNNPQEALHVVGNAEITGTVDANKVANGLGSEGSPSYTFSGDLNTGIWRPSNDLLAFSTAGSERMRLQSDGTLCVGTNSDAPAGLSVTSSENSAFRAHCTQEGYGGMGAHIWNGEGSWVYCGYTDGGGTRYKVAGNGIVSFTQNHPESAGEVIVYTSPEGDEVATYTRGTGRLTGGTAEVSLGKTFKWVTNPDIGLTAHVTPREQAVPLAVSELTTEKIVVVGPAGSDDVVFDYIVYGLRIGFEETSVVQEKTQESGIPSKAAADAYYENHPDRRSHNALSRFEKMEAACGMPERDCSAATALREAVGNSHR